MASAVAAIEKTSIFNREKIVERVTEKLLALVACFDEGMG